MIMQAWIITALVLIRRNSKLYTEGIIALAKLLNKSPERELRDHRSGSEQILDTIDKHCS